MAVCVHTDIHVPSRSGSPAGQYHELIDGLSGCGRGLIRCTVVDTDTTDACENIPPRPLTGLSDRILMAQLNVKLTAERLEALRHYAARRRTPVAWLIKDYVDYLIGGG
jgi:hypothetical protein